MTHQNISYIPLDIAVCKYRISKKVLRQRAESGKLKSVRLADGGLLVANHDIDPSLNIKREDFERLRGQEISISEAARNYKIAPRTLSRWADAGYIHVIDRGWKVILDEVDVAYCGAVYKAKYDFYDGQMSGVPIFDEEGAPFQAKYPEMAAYRRKQRHRQKQL